MHDYPAIDLGCRLKGLIFSPTKVQSIDDVAFFRHYRNRMQRFEIVIVGAGWHGLAMAKTFLEVHPNCSMLIIDSAASVGGTWAKERLYPGLKTNNLLGTYEFSDFPMTPEKFGVKPGRHIPGEAVHEYLVQFCGHFDLSSRVRLGQKPESAELLGNANKGSRVQMVVRPSGGGPSWLWPVFFSPLKISIQRLAATRVSTRFDPCIWSERTGPTGWLRCALHGTWLGRKIVARYWQMIEYFAHRAFLYDDHPETQKFKPWVSPFWMGNSLSIHNYDSLWFDLVRAGKIKIQVADVERLSEKAVYLSNGANLATNAIVCCTGWDAKPPINFLPPAIDSALGLEGPSPDDLNLLDQARTELFTKLPVICYQPKRSLPPGSKQPELEIPTLHVNAGHRFYLYRFMVPSNDRLLCQRNIAFIGAHISLHATMIAQLQALWITAFFTNELANLKPETLENVRVHYETVLHNEYTRVRHPHCAGGAGERCLDLAFDCLAYMDLLADDLGLEKYRKYRTGGILSEIFHRYTPHDYAGMVRAWMTMTRKQDVIPL
ncbi:hypothetical protein SUNI508_13218 [Seiridium unicorne]|uniref:Uncharacterized protein n=1 Tax=Seiridium unicorne TaxID=138068 RepID=A0ABR2VFM0_9PEZI